jgi:hypothetical protein
VLKSRVVERRLNTLPQMLFGRQLPIIGLFKPSAAVEKTGRYGIAKVGEGGRQRIQPAEARCFQADPAAQNILLIVNVCDAGSVAPLHGHSAIFKGHEISRRGAEVQVSKSSAPAATAVAGKKSASYGICPESRQQLRNFLFWEQWVDGGQNRLNVILGEL